MMSIKRINPEKADLFHTSEIISEISDYVSNIWSIGEESFGTYGLEKKEK